MLTGHQLPGALTTAEFEALPEALAIAEAACQPASARELARALGEMTVLMKSRPESTFDTQAWTVAVIRRLADYPAGVALEVIETQPNMGPFLPSWDELKARLDLYACPLKAVRDTLRRAADLPVDDAAVAAQVDERERRAKRLREAREVEEHRKREVAASLDLPQSGPDGFHDTGEVFRSVVDSLKANGDARERAARQRTDARRAEARERIKRAAQCVSGKADAGDGAAAAEQLARDRAEFLRKLDEAFGDKAEVDVVA